MIDRLSRLRSVADSGLEPTDFTLSRWLFLRLLGLVYLIAFVSLGVQVSGLVGPDGILPAAEFLERVHEAIGADAYRRLPTFVWISASDGFLQALCWVGAALSVTLIAGVSPVPVLLLLWTLYLSLTVAGQAFLSFQWDVLLLEAGLLAALYAPDGWRPRITEELAGTSPPPSTAARWLLWFLVFRLIFLSGATKLASGDATWRDWTALDYHFQTQPIPTWTAWWSHQSPEWLLKASLGGMYFAELIVPFCVLVSPRPIVRRAACLLLVVFQLGIAATGNYGFFNLLTIVLCLTLLDDPFLRRLLPKRLASWLAVGRADPEAAKPRPIEGPLKRTALAIAAPVLVVLASLSFVREITRTLPSDGLQGPDWVDGVLAVAAPFRSVNGYGLFRVMTTERPEIVIEGSADGESWREYDFRWKPGALNRRPRFVAPHQPRLDWQMWFAALNPQAAQGWLVPLLRGLLQGSPEVLGLVGEDPFADGQPAYVRLAYYRYTFTTSGERSESGDWWDRELLGYLTGPLSLDDLE